MKNSPDLFLKVLAVVGVLCLFGWTVAQTQERSPQVSTQAQLVILSMIVTDKSGHSLADVDRKELQVLEDGKPQELTSVTKETKPVKYAIAIDNSESFRSLLAPSLEACKLIIDLNGPADETALIRFVSSDKIDEVQDFTADKSRLVDALKQLYFEGGKSAVIDAVYLAVESAARRPAADFSGRRAVVLISDGEERLSVHKIDDLVKLLRENEVQVFVIGITAQLEDYASVGLSRKQKAEKLLTRLAQETGGRAIFPTHLSELQVAAREIAHDLHTQFTISYRAAESTQKGFHKVEVKIVGRQKSKAITRSGYVHQ